MRLIGTIAKYAVATVLGLTFLVWLAQIGDAFRDGSIESAIRYAGHRLVERYPENPPLEWVKGWSFWTGFEFGVPFGAAGVILCEVLLNRRSKRRGPI